MFADAPFSAAPFAAQGAAGQIFSEALADTVSLSDSLTSTAVQALSLEDTVTLSDTYIGGLSLSFHYQIPYR